MSEVKQAEEFADVLHEKLKFPSQWALWEHYDTSDYQKSMRKVAWFDDVISFSESWQNLPHQDVKNFFYNEESKQLNVHQIDGEEKRINGFSLFEYNIQPEWEDPVNEQGGEWKFDFKAPIAVVQKLWEKLVFQTVTGEFAEVDKLCGVRLLDKSANGKESFFRIEIWTKLASEQEAEGQLIRKYLDEVFIDGILKKCENPLVSLHSTKFVNHKP